ncbi:hypothetical protein CQW23_19816 [Capsicum baccatum]|uniref:Uncharacterized protein n=1 Tax=Capsicum baccatum TaxID=33114 RepID=A0A2G2W6W5_CAPBA|nr:hypothetical protein CQW23_19816 [Capsicum baccatum]
MAGVAVLQPHDVGSYRQMYVQPVRSRRNSSSNPPPNPNYPKKNRRKRSPQKSGSSSNFSTCSPAKNKNLHLVMGEVKILKRGEVLTNNNFVSSEVVEDLVLSTADRLGPEPDMVPKHVTIADLYAGSAFFSSPPPSSLPLPAFFKKKSDEDNHEATSDLRRLLRLDLP